MLPQRGSPVEGAGKGTSSGLPSGFLNLPVHIRTPPAISQESPASLSDHGSGVALAMDCGMIADEDWIPTY